MKMVFYPKIKIEVEMQDDFEHVEEKINEISCKLAHDFSFKDKQCEVLNTEFLDPEKENYYVIEAKDGFFIATDPDPSDTVHFKGTLNEAEFILNRRFD